ncbi:MAG: hypothetical protein PXX83_07610 [Candidatus Nitrosotalea sp.]|nr:hypothetical protein [Candidatus Nitrosotalea sp.]
MQTIDVFGMILPGHKIRKSQIKQYKMIGIIHSSSSGYQVDLIFQFGEFSSHAICTTSTWFKKLMHLPTGA